ncbi:MAG: ComEC/Rec2 family competence protein [Treponemataceae bacterium]
MVKSLKLIKKTLIELYLEKIIQNISVVKLTSFLCLFAILVFSLKPRTCYFHCLLNDEKITEAEGYVCSNPILTSSKKYYACNFVIDKAYSKNGIYGAKGKISVLIPKEIVEAHYPNRIYTKSACKDVFVENGAYLKLRLCSIDKNKHLFISKQVEFIKWKNYLAFIRGNSRINFKRLLCMWGYAGGFLLALLAGSKEYTNTILTQSFRNAGLSHILALSGMHVSIFSGSSEKIIGKFAGKRITEFISLLSVLLFVWFAGISPSLARAMFSSIFGFFCSKLSIKPKILDVLCFSFLLQIMIFPSDFSSLSFALSYLALFGVLTAGELIKKYINLISGTYLSNQLSSSFGAILFTSPVCAKIFGFITPIGIISCLIISPLVTYFLITGLIFIIFSLMFPFFAKPLGSILQMLYYVIEKVSIFFAMFPPLKIG